MSIFGKKALPYEEVTCLRNSQGAEYTGLASQRDNWSEVHLLGWMSGISAGRQNGHLISHLNKL